ncbi:MAG: hypothetical protein ABFD98_05565, partial [Syntrophobacteraceae bacterium]
MRHLFQVRVQHRVPWRTDGSGYCENPCDMRPAICDMRSGAFEQFARRRSGRANCKFSSTDKVGERLSPGFSFRQSPLADRIDPPIALGILAALDILNPKEAQVWMWTWLALPSCSIGVKHEGTLAMSIFFLQPRVLIIRMNPKR